MNGGAKLDIGVIEKDWINVSVYLKNAILELRNIPCGCTKENDLICTKCCLMDDIKNIRHDVNKEITRLMD